MTASKNVETTKHLIDKLILKRQTNREKNLKIFKEMESKMNSLETRVNKTHQVKDCTAYYS